MEFLKDVSWAIELILAAFTLLVAAIAGGVVKLRRSERIKDQLEQEAENERKRREKLEAEIVLLKDRLFTETSQGYLERIDEFSEETLINENWNLTNNFLRDVSPGVAQALRIKGRRGIELAESEGTQNLHGAEKFLLLAESLPYSRIDVQKDLIEVRALREVVKSGLSFDEEMKLLLDPEALSATARKAGEEGRTPQAILLRERELKLREITGDVNSRAYWTSILDIARQLSRTGLHDEALAYTRSFKKHARNSVNKALWANGAIEYSLVVTKGGFSGLDLEAVRWLVEAGKTYKSDDELQDGYPVALDCIATHSARVGKKLCSIKFHKAGLAELRKSQNGASVRLSVACHNLAYQLLTLDRFDEAEELFDEAIASDVKIGRDLHSEHGVKLENLALLYERTGRVADAASMLAKTRDIYLQSIPDNDAAIAKVESKIEQLT